MATAQLRPHRSGNRTATLRVDGLTVEITRRGRSGRAINGVSLEVWPGEIVGLIGESGSGKSMTALSVLGLNPPGTKVVQGEIHLGEESLTAMSSSEMRRVRGRRVAMVPQDAMAAMNPVLRVNTQVGEPFVVHRRLSWSAAKEKAVPLLRSVHVPSPAQRGRDYPHQFSGGMLQRAMIAMGLALEPELLIADEPTTALDVTIQAQVLRLLGEVRDEHGTAILFITHDLGVVAEVCDWVYVMYAGRIVEEGSVESILNKPSHPYTQALLRATPGLEARREELESIEGRMPAPFEWSAACRFADRCPFRFEHCAEEPPLLAVESEHAARCWLVEDDSEKHS
jgi:oligopeptide/dipeptide ABC transporter ATP-binding protein